IKKNVTELVEAAVLTRSSSQPMSTYEAATLLSEFERTKIMIDKMEKNKSYDKADYKKKLYDALVESGLETTVTKIKTPPMDHTEVRKEGNQVKRLSPPEIQEELSHTVEDSGMQQDQEFVMGDNDEQSADKEVTKADWFKKPERPPTLDPNWNLEYLNGGDLSRRYSTSVTKSKAATYELKWIEDLVPELWSPVQNHCSYLEEIEVRRDDHKLYTFKEGDFKRLRLQDIEDMLLLLVQQKLTNLTIDERYDLNMALRYKQAALSEEVDAESRNVYWWKDIWERSQAYGKDNMTFEREERGSIDTHFVNDDNRYTDELKGSKTCSTNVDPRVVENKDQHAYFGTSHWGLKRQSFYRYASNLTSSKDVYSRRRIIAVTRLTIMKKYDYGHLEEINVRRDDQKLYTFKKGDFKRLCLQDIEDMLLLLVQTKLANLTIDKRYDLNVALRMFTRRIIIQRRVEDLQLGVEGYQKKLNLTKPDTYRPNLNNKTAYTSHSDPYGIIYVDQFKRKRLMRTDELHKFSDGTLSDVQTTLHDIAAGIRMEYLPMRKWSNLDKKRAWVMVQDIDKQLYQRRLIRNLDMFVGGRIYEKDLRLL
ncbi:hypothetical protein Tco_1081132, partial [Tanacetum coccineum]